MRVKMKTIYAGPSGSAPPGKVIDLPDAEANALVAGGYATPVEAPAPAAVPPVAPEAPVETATEPAAQETATAPRQKAGKGKR